MKILNSKLIRDISYVYPNYVSVPRYFPFSCSLTMSGTLRQKPREASRREERASHGYATYATTREQWAHIRGVHPVSFLSGGIQKMRGTSLAWLCDASADASRGFVTIQTVNIY